MRPALSERVLPTRKHRNVKECRIVSAVCRAALPADAVMISNLVVIGGHETFVSGLRPEGHPDEAGGLESLRAAVTPSGVCGRL